MKIKRKKNAIMVSFALVAQADTFSVCLWDNLKNNCVIHVQEIDGKLYWLLDDTVNDGREIRPVDEYDDMAEAIWKNRKYINQSGQLNNQKGE